MKIGILGSGIVGRTLGDAFLKQGHEVMLGSRNISKDEVVKWKAEHPNAQTGDFTTTAKYGELLVLAGKGSIITSIIGLAGKEHFASKIVIDTTNPIADEAPVNGVLNYFTSPNDSLLENIQRLLPEAYLVKAFNSVGSAMMYQPDYNGNQPTMFICGNETDAKHKVSEILKSFGWETADMGKAESARAIEPLAMLWCTLGFNQNEWTHAFKLLHK